MPLTIASITDFLLCLGTIKILGGRRPQSAWVFRRVSNLVVADPPRPLRVLGLQHVDPLVVLYCAHKSKTPEQFFQTHSVAWESGERRFAPAFAGCLLGISDSVVEEIMRFTEDAGDSRWRCILP